MEEYYLYIIMRSDLASMTPGRACAQASHATSIFENEYKLFTHLNKKYEEWRDSTGYFGTTIVLDAGKEQLREISERLWAKSSEDEVPLAMGKCTDPTYAVQDGSVTHYVEIDTCMYIFAPKDWMKENSGLSLY